MIAAARQTLRVTCAVLALAGPIVALTACERKEGPAEKLGAAVDDAVDGAKDTVDDAVDGAKDAVDDAKGAMD